MRGNYQSNYSGGLILWIMSVILLCHCSLSLAGQERYDYDALGRLIRVIDEQGYVTEYTYDPAGNLLKVTTGSGNVTPPTLSSFTPNALRRGETKQFTAIGTAFTGVRLSTSDAGLVLNNLRLSITNIQFDLTATDTAALGAQTITLRNAAGSAIATVTVNPLLPKVEVAPLPLAVPPDNSSHPFSIKLSNADNIDHSFTLSVSDASIISVSPANLTIPAGQTEVQASVSGRNAGLASITITSTTLGTILVPVFVTAEFRGINTSYAPLLGVVVEQPPTPPQPQTITPVSAAHLGVIIGGHIKNIVPQAVAIGSGPVDLTITGAGLSGVTNVTMVPNDGLTLGVHSVDASGTTMTLPITIANNALTTTRQLILKVGTQTIPPASAEADRIKIVLPTPEVTSVDPLFVIPGTTIQNFFVRGRNLQGAQVTITPAAGITVDSSPVINVAGSEMVLKVTISPIAPLGPRVVMVTTPGGTSSATSSPVNTLTIVNELKETFTSISAPLLGVVVEPPPTPPVSQTIGLQAAQVGVSVGRVITSMNPVAGSIGEAVTLTLAGNELQGVTEVKLFPNDGITVGVPVVAVNGQSLTVDITIASNAPQTVRNVQVLAGTILIPAAPIAVTQFRVTTPQPEIYSVTPLFLQVGQSPITLTIGGKNFQNIQAVRVVPSQDVSFGTVTINTDATQATVNISALANAALGSRVVIVETAAGATSSTSTVANTLTLTNTTGTTFTPITAPSLGVLVQEPPAPPVQTTIGPIVAPNLGLMLVLQAILQLKYHY